MTDDYVVK